MLLNLRKRATGKGQVVETNPGVGNSEIYKTPASEPSMDRAAQGISNLSIDTSTFLGKPHVHEGKVGQLLSEAKSLHGDKKFAKAHEKLAQAFGHVSFMDGITKGKESLSNYKPTYGGGKTMSAHSQDIRAELEAYKSGAEKWHSENPNYKSPKDLNFD
jgi:hypothetical protein